MKKVVYNQYGDFSRLQMVDVEMPVPAHDEVLVKVKAVAINPLDWKLLEGQLKIVTGKKFPRSIGIEFAGVIETIGRAVQNFKFGDQVFGLVETFKGGALAEFVAVKENSLAKMPEGLSFAQAASIPIGALSAMQMIDTLAHVKKGDEVLINGATGGVGVFAIQMAKRRGATVTAVVSTRGIELAKDLGSDFVVDYSKENTLEMKKRFDVILDLSDKLRFSMAKPLLKPQSVYATSYPNPVDLVRSALHNAISRQKWRILTMKNDPAQMKEVCQFIQAGMKVIVGKSDSFANYQQAFRETKKSGVLGKSVIVF
ncbi:MAG: NAD(P)-dependent alcohol dehydrogenase [Caldilineaceae bacterium]